MEKFPKTGTASQFPETCGPNAASTVGRSVGTVQRGKGIPRVSKTERRQKSTQILFKKRWIEVNVIDPEELLLLSSLWSIAR